MMTFVMLAFKTLSNTFNGLLTKLAITIEIILAVLMNFVLGVVIKWLTILKWR